MGVKNYLCANGVVFSELSAGVRADYVDDGLGRVVNVCDSNANVSGTFRYNPFGSSLSSAGTPPDYGWGIYNRYRTTGTKYAELWSPFVTYSTLVARYPVQDAGGPNVYAVGRPAATDVAPICGSDVNFSWGKMTPVNIGGACGALAKNCSEGSFLTIWKMPSTGFGKWGRSFKRFIIRGIITIAQRALLPYALQKFPVESLRREVTSRHGICYMA
jgi:hypothetical protein